MGFAEKIRDQRGATLVETAVAITIVLTIVLATSVYFTSGNSGFERNRIKRAAFEEVKNRMEEIAISSYYNLDSMSETAVPVTLGEITGYRDTIVDDIDDALDGTGSGDNDGNTIDYKRIRVILRWTLEKEYSITFETYRSEF